MSKKESITEYEYEPAVNKPIKIFGIAIGEMAILIIGVGGLVILGGVISTIGVNPQIYYLFVVALFFLGILVLKRANKHDQNDYLISWISFKLFQPKKMKLLRNKITTKNKL